jgi:hypothetical protein
MPPIVIDEVRRRYLLILILVTLDSGVGNGRIRAYQLYRPDLDVRRWSSSNVVVHPIALIT